MNKYEYFAFAGVQNPTGEFRVIRCWKFDTKELALAAGNEAMRELSQLHELTGRDTPFGDNFPALQRNDPHSLKSYDFNVALVSDNPDDCAIMDYQCWQALWRATKKRLEKPREMDGIAERFIRIVVEYSENNEMATPAPPVAGVDDLPLHYSAAKMDDASTDGLIPTELCEENVMLVSNDPDTPLRVIIENVNDITKGIQDAIIVTKIITDVQRWDIKSREKYGGTGWADIAKEENPTKTGKELRAKETEIRKAVTAFRKNHNQ
ncbi:hypothetical protein FACS189454_08470 [Planctomycetales bacterium]|nr:hypothetical protein FACS189454_08470 [Planctomycetales bacterium]